MMGVFLDWWGRQLWQLVPARWRSNRPAHDTGDAVLFTLVEPLPGQRAWLDVVRRRGRRDVQLGRFVLDEAGLGRLRAALGAARRGAIRLILPPRLLLEQQVTLPLAAERGLETALRWEMDRLTPFRADAVFWSWQVEHRDRDRARLLLRLRLVPKAAVAAVLEMLGATGLAPTLLASSADPAITVPLTGPLPARGHTRAIAAVVFAVALVAAIAAPFARQQIEAARIGAQIAALQPDVAIAEGLRRRLLERAAGADVVAAQAARVGDALYMLEAVTEVLPDDTSLSDLALRDRVLTITGLSAGASRLVPALAADPAFRNPVFAAPVTRNEFTGIEAFTITTELRP